MVTPRKSVAAASVYHPPLEGRRQSIRLDFNENTQGFAAAMPELPVELLSAYPEYQQLIEQLAGHHDLPPNCVMLTNGSGEGIFTIAFAFLEPGVDVAVTSKPTFSLIPHNLNLCGATVVEISVRPDLAFDIEAIEAVLERGAKLVVLASPDNPTGSVLGRSTVLEWCERFKDTLFCMDEAYAEYTHETLLADAPRHDNLLVTRTFSKAWSLAGLRLGFVVGTPENLEILMRVRSPYSVNATAVLAASRMLERSAEVLRIAAASVSRRGGFAQAIRERGFRVAEGHANFLLLYVGPDATRLCEFAAKRGVLVRDRSSLPALRGMIRVTVGTKQENQAFLNILDAFQQTHALIFDLDGTLVDTSQSYDTSVLELVEELTGSPIEPADLSALRGEGGFNDDWEASQELAGRRGFTVAIDAVSKRGKELYLARARDIETQLIGSDTLQKLAKRYRLFVLTGRSRGEYEPVWADRLDPLFERVYCHDDLPQLPKKPAPDMLKEILHRHQCRGGFYVGDLVDDVVAAKGADLFSIAITGTVPREKLESLAPDLILDSGAAVADVFGV